MAQKENGTPFLEASRGFFESHSTPEELFESGFFGGSPAPMYKKSGNPWGLPLFKFYLTRVTGVGE